ncbi:unnamed protein product [Parnassius apollo]|uniref:(apollo) hypothetical protein n=1 Tax=Parnassius apollo TaxID=110799 RepID=A0A8S3Y4Z6_PARAO|nr:unnamed protein product [Parnassius apollo]
MPLQNARINKLKNISRRLLEDTQDDKEEFKKRTCHGIQNEPVHLESANTPTTHQTSKNHCESTRNEEEINQNANEDISTTILDLILCLPKKSHLKITRKLNRFLITLPKTVGYSYLIISN